LDPTVAVHLGGDKYNPFESNGFAPIDERPRQVCLDSQKSASNANDLRRQILADSS